MTKSERKFAKRLRHQIDDITAGTRFTIDAKTGRVTPDDGKKHKAKSSEVADGKAE